MQHRIESDFRAARVDDYDYDYEYESTTPDVPCKRPERRQHMRPACRPKIEVDRGLPRVHTPGESDESDEAISFPEKPQRKRAAREVRKWRRGIRTA